MIGRDIFKNMSILTTKNLKNERHPWYPYVTPWSYGQVLSVYRDTDDDEVNTPMLEIRRFYRAADLPSDLEEMVPPANDPEREQVFESEDIVDGLSASNVLGLFLMCSRLSSLSGDGCRICNGIPNCSMEWHLWPPNRLLQLSPLSRCAAWRGVGIQPCLA